MPLAYYCPRCGTLDQREVDTEKVILSLHPGEYLIQLVCGYCLEDVMLTSHPEPLTVSPGSTRHRIPMPRLIEFPCGQLN